MQRALDNKTKPLGSLGRIEEIGLRLATLQRTLEPRADSKYICVFAGSHGITEEGVSPYPAEVTGQMVRNFVAGGAAINVFARLLGIHLRVIDVGVDGDLSDLHAENFFHSKVRAGTRNFLKAEAMTTDEMAAAMGEGAKHAREVAAEGAQLLGIGEMGIGNTTSASALIVGLGILTPEEAAGRGAGLDDAGVRRKAEIIRAAVQFHAQCGNDPAKWLQSVGGYEIAAMAGLILEAAKLRLAVVVDGFITTAAAAIACAIDSGASEVCFYAHRSNEKAHGALLAHLGAEPLLDLGMRLGEGTGAALAMNLLDAAARVLREMASFESAGVSTKSE